MTPQVNINTLRSPSKVHLLRDWTSSGSSRPASLAAQKQYGARSVDTMCQPILMSYVKWEGETIKFIQNLQRKFVS